MASIFDASNYSDADPNAVGYDTADTMAGTGLSSDTAGSMAGFDPNIVGYDTGDTMAGGGGTGVGYDTADTMQGTSPDTGWLNTIINATGQTASGALKWAQDNPGLATSILGAAGIAYDRAQKNEPVVGRTTVTTGGPDYLNEWAGNVARNVTRLPLYESGVDAPGMTLANSDIAGYMNPYVQSVFAPQAQRMKEDQANEINTLRAKGGADAWGTRGALLENLSNERFNKRYDEAEAGALGSAFNTATGLASQDIGTRWKDYNQLYESPYQQQTAANTALGAVSSALPKTTSTDTYVQNPRPDLMAQLASVGSIAAGYGGLGNKPKN